MNADTLQGKWKQLRGDVKSRWGKLTDDDLDVIDGNLDKLVGKVQELYGEARETVLDWMNKLGDRARDVGDDVGDEIRDARKKSA